MEHDSLLPSKISGQTVACLIDSPQFDYSNGYDRFFENIMEGFSQLASELEKHHYQVKSVDFPRAPTIEQFSEDVSGLNLRGRLELLASEDDFGFSISTHSETEIGHWPSVFVSVPNSLWKLDKISVDGKDYVFSSHCSCRFWVLNPKEPQAWITKDGMSIVTLMRGLGAALVSQPEVSDLTRFSGFTLTRNPPLSAATPANDDNTSRDTILVLPQDPVAPVESAKTKRGVTRLSIGFLKKIFA